ncbi:AAA family ATPase [Shewanella xiamenensis]|uniref:AAA family ATPase n=1 Tax=Shewanella xiamenensis TaxID=332186 RepID=UPI001C4E2126|nr:AAA family ATPase [Shewanella xiamenensis]MBW0296399.1 AAA family ATPase [Shewanella xiamenensis]MDH1313812.1 AAA family ATPase [Shewanella xiamenensis]
MTFQGQVLLPSQEALIQRLHHVASYSDQLLVLVGGQGSGKTTLLTALATDFDDSNAALVICPMHADNAEIRRKILVQLMSSPIFDDEIPLAETILRVAQNQSKPLHIIIDDAHLLSKELWAECIILNQIQCAGQRIAVTLTVPPAFLADLLPQLPDSLRRQILPISIEPLSLPEREALYQTLLRYSDQNPFTPRDIVRAQLEKQTGTPQEVVTLLELALHGQSEKKSVWVHYKVAVLGLCSLLITFLIWFGLAQPFSDEPVLDVVTYPALDSDEFLAHGQRILTPYFKQREESLAQFLLSQAALQADPLAGFHGETPAENESAITQPIDEATSKAENNVATASNNTSHEDIAKNDNVHPAKNITAASITNVKTRPTSGYTIQIATVSQRDTVESLLKKLHSVPDIRVAKYKQFWVVLVGQFSDSQSAQQAAAELVKQYRLSQPMIKKWAELGGYQLQDALPSGEISE